MNDAVNYSKITEGKMFYYGIFENGKIIKTLKSTYAETSVSVYLKRGHATVKIANKEHTVKNLVAKAFIPNYKPGDYVEVINGDPFDCHINNIRIYSKSEHGKRTGHKSSSLPVIVNGLHYRSIRTAAKSLHVSYQTLLDYMAGKHKKSVLCGFDIQSVERGNMRHV